MILNSDAKFKEKLTCSFKHDMRNLINFHPIKSLKISPRRALFVQSIKAWDKKIKRSYLWWHWKVVPNVSENWLVAWKMTRNFVTFHASSWKSENLHLMGSFCRKHKVLDEKVQKSYLSWHWRVMQSLKKSWLLTLGFMTNLVNFNASSRNFENLHFDVLLLSIACKVSAKKVEEKLTFCLKNQMRNLMNFYSNSEKSENLHFDGIFLSNVCNVSAKMIQTSRDLSRQFY